MAHFIQLVLDEFAALHPGNAVRFGIRSLELAAWSERHGGAVLPRRRNGPGAAATSGKRG